MWGEGGVFQKIMDDAEIGWYVSFPLDYYNSPVGVAIAMPASIFGYCNCDAGVAIAMPENI